MDWRPKAPILANSAESVPTKPSKPRSVGFEGGTSGESPEIRVGPSTTERWCAWAEWKAAALNRLFQEQGATGKPGRITAATVRHGERNTRGTE
jgi:hypothetical protein